MSINNEEEFKIDLNHKAYLINISILEDQLSLVLTLLDKSPKQYSGFFSLGELRISSKIFHHTNSLFEAKEIIKRTVIKKQLLINEDEHKAKIIFDTGLGSDSIPFPIILFRDLNVNHLTKSQTLEELKKAMNINNKNKIMKMSPLNNKQNLKNQIDENNHQNNLLKGSIGNNINNKMLNNNFDDINLGKSIVINNVTFNNNIISKRTKENNLDNIKNNNLNNPNLSYKKVDLTNNVFMNKTNANKEDAKDFIEKNNKILYNMYNNMNNNNNINSSFYKNLQNSFISFDNKQKKNNTPLNNANIKDNLQNNGINNININNRNQTFLQQNGNIMKNNSPENNNIFFNPHKSMNPPKNSIFNNVLKGDFKEKNIRGRYMSPKKSFKTSPVENNNIARILENDNYKLNQEKQPKDRYRYKNNSEKKSNENDEEEENDEESNIDLDENIDEGNLGQKNYHFKNLKINRPRKVKGHLEKFKESQNMGDYVPSGTKFVSYLKFPDTKPNIRNSYASTLSSSVTSSSNRIPGIEKNIVNNPGEMDEITSRIKRILNKRNIKFKIIYRGTEHGDSSSKFHEKCDNIKNTLVLVHTSSNKRFGGFTTQTWDGEDINKKDDSCFIFSIDKMRIYDIIEGQNAIICNPDCGPVFINQIKLLDKYFTQGGTTSYKGKTFQTLENFELTGGAEKFGIKEVEVYQIK